MANFQVTGPNRVPRVLFFIAGMNPSDEEKEQAGKLGPNVGIRNALQVAALAVSSLEECDAVAGPAIPERYANAYPNVNGLNTDDRLLRMSDLDRAHGPIHHVDNEAARAARPPSLGQDRTMAQGAPRPVGAITAGAEGFVAPAPGSTNIPAQGSERTENAAPGAGGEGTQGPAVNPQRLPDGGVSLPPAGSTGDGVAGAVASGGGVGGFQPPTPAVDDEDEADTGGPSGRGRKRGGATGSTGSTGDTGSTGQ